MKFIVILALFLTVSLAQVRDTHIVELIVSQIEKDKPNKLEHIIWARSMFIPISTLNRYVSGNLELIFRQVASVYFQSYDDVKNYRSGIDPSSFKTYKMANKLDKIRSNKNDASNSYYHNIKEILAYTDVKSDCHSLIKYYNSIRDRRKSSSVNEKNMCKALHFLKRNIAFFTLNSDIGKRRGFKTIEEVLNSNLEYDSLRDDVKKTKK